MSAIRCLGLSQTLDLAGKSKMQSHVVTLHQRTRIYGRKLKQHTCAPVEDRLVAIYEEVGHCQGDHQANSNPSRTSGHKFDSFSFDSLPVCCNSTVTNKKMRPVPTSNVAFDTKVKSSW